MEKKINQKVKCVYYKDSGKYYGEGETVIDLVAPSFKGCIYPIDFGRRMNMLHRLPGLQSGSWRGPFTIEMEYIQLVPAQPEQVFINLNEEEGRVLTDIANNQGLSFERVFKQALKIYQIYVLREAEGNPIDLGISQSPGLGAEE